MGWNKFSSSNGTVVSISTNGFPSSGWPHVAGVFTGTEIKIYINGQLKRTRSFTGNIQLSDSKVVVGGYDGGKVKFEGLVDEVKIYSGGLSDTDIQDIFNKGSIGKSAN